MGQLLLGIVCVRKEGLLKNEHTPRSQLHKKGVLLVRSDAHLHFLQLGDDEGGRVRSSDSSTV